MSWEIRQGDALDRLREIPDGSIHCCVTSPPYWGLRDYGTAEWEGGDPDCEHRVGGQVPDTKAGGAIVAGVRPGVDASACIECGAERVDGQLGLEATPEEYVTHIVEVFREVRRALRDDGTLWLNLGDSYAGSPRGNAPGDLSTSSLTNPERQEAASRDMIDKSRLPGVKPKDLVGIPWMVAFALRADSWWLRSDVVWAKPNPMPESVVDRPTRSHEYVFLLTKSARYFYDAEAIREQATYAGPNGRGRSPHAQGFRERSRDEEVERQDKQRGHGRRHAGFNDRWDQMSKAEQGALGRNKRSVWTVATRPYSEAHFATFPPALVEPCILAGTSPRCCGECGAPWTRVVERERSSTPVEASTDKGEAREAGEGHYPPNSAETGGVGGFVEVRTVGWEQTCDHDDGSGQAVVLDPFSGAATTGLVAVQSARDYIGIELNPEYVEMSETRIRRWEANPAGHLTGDPEPIEGQMGLEI